MSECIEVTNEFLKEQFQRCEQWNDPEQWEHLAELYQARGYVLNANYCMKQAETCRELVLAE